MQRKCTLKINQYVVLGLMPLFPKFEKNSILTDIDINCMFSANTDSTYFFRDSNPHYIFTNQTINPEDFHPC